MLCVFDSGLTGIVLSQSLVDELGLCERVPKSPPPEPAPPRRSMRIAGRTKTPPPTHAAYKRAALCLAPRHA